MSEILNIFAIYTSEDKDSWANLLGHMKPFEGDGNVSIWDDNPILSGQQWKPQVESRLNHTDIFLLLVSNTLLHSQFVQQIEFKWIIDRYKENKSVVIPILLDKCQWDIDFNADEYTFNFNELQVLPEGKRPIVDWNPKDQAYRSIALGLKKAIASIRGADSQEEVETKEDEKIVSVEKEEQTALHFSKEEEASEKVKEIGQEEIEKNSIAAQQSKRIAEEEAKKKAAKIREEEAHRIALAAQEKKRIEEEEAKKRAKEERRRIAEANRSAEERRRLKKDAEAKREKAAAEEKRREELRKKSSAQAIEEVEEIEQEVNTNIKKRLLPGLLIAALAIIGIWAFLKLKEIPEKPISTLPETTILENEDSIVLEKTKIDTVEKVASLSKIGVGEIYSGGMIFSIDSSGKTGKIVHLEDAGPMPWQKANKIHEQLGEGWRLPTLNELVTLRKTLGQGADNSAEFADGLYWSATAFDEHQARLLKFSNGNTSYHYNRNVETRKFRVRAVRDFSR